MRVRRRVGGERRELGIPLRVRSPSGWDLMTADSASLSPVGSDELDAVSLYPPHVASYSSPSSNSPDDRFSPLTPPESLPDEACVTPVRPVQPMAIPPPPKIEKRRQSVRLRDLTTGRVLAETFAELPFHEGGE